MNSRSRFQNAGRAAAGLAVLVVCLWAGAARTQQNPPAAQKQYTLVLLYPQWKSEEEVAKFMPVLREHAAHMTKLFEADKLVFGGPRVDRVYGMGILETETAEEAERLMRDDPAVKAAAFRLEFYPVQGAFVRKANAAAAQAKSGS